MGHEDVEAVDDLCHGNGLILLPILNILSAVNKDDEVVVLALVVDLGLSGMSTRHVGGFGRSRLFRLDWMRFVKKSWLAYR